MIIGLLLVRDEDDILNDNIEFHIKNGIDLFIVTNHASTDNTRKLLSSNKYIHTIIDTNDSVYRQPEWTTAMVKIAYELKAEWIIPLDADELWLNISMLNSIDNKYDKVLYGTMLKHYPYEVTTNNIFSRYPYYKQVPTRGKLAFRPSLYVKTCLGNHKVKGLPLKCYKDDKFIIHHFPERSLEHFKKKCKNAESLFIHGGNKKSPWYKLYLAYKEDRIEEYYNQNILVKEKPLADKWTPEYVN